MSGAPVFICVTGTRATEIVKLIKRLDPGLECVTNPRAGPKGCQEVLIVNDGDEVDGVEEVAYPSAVEMTRIDYRNPLQVMECLGRLTDRPRMQVGSLYRPINPTTVVAVFYSGAPLCVPDVYRPFVKLFPMVEGAPVSNSGSPFVYMGRPGTVFGDVRRAVDDALILGRVDERLIIGGERGSRAIGDPSIDHVIFTMCSPPVLELARNMILSSLANGVPLRVYSTPDAIPELRRYPVEVVPLEGVATVRDILFSKFAITDRLLNLGKTVIYLDCDTVIMRDGFSGLVEFLRNSRYDMLIQSSMGNQYCTGFFVVKPTALTRRIFRVSPGDADHFQGADQHYFNNIIGPQLNVFRLPPWLCPVGGLLKKSPNGFRQALLVHFNGFKGPQEKIQFMINHGYWLLDYLERYRFVFLCRDPSAFSKLYRAVVRMGVRYDLLLTDSEDPMIIVTDQARYLIPALPAIVSAELEFEGSSSSGGPVVYRSGGITGMLMELSKITV